MKWLFLALLSVTWALSAYTQGTVEFDNLNGPTVNAPVYEADGVTKLSGPQFMAGLLAGALADNLAPVATTGFLQGNLAGYFHGGGVTIPGMSEGRLAWVQVDVWNTASGASFAQAQASGLPNSWWQSSVFSVTLGGGTVNPAPPAVLTGLGNSPVFLNSVPEPSTFALAGLGVALAVLRVGRGK